PDGSRDRRSRAGGPGATRVGDQAIPRAAGGDGEGPADPRGASGRADRGHGDGLVLAAVLRLAVGHPLYTSSMRLRRVLAGMLAAAALLGAAQYLRSGNRWAKYEHEMQNPVDDPPDALVPAEFAFARLRFRSPRDGYFRRHLRWGTDTNKSDRIFMQA